MQNKEETTKTTVVISPPKFQRARFKIIGESPLVIHRFSLKVKEGLKNTMETGKPATSRKNRQPKSVESLYEEARYRSPEGWDGFNASAIRRGMIEVCRLVGFKMVLAKLSVFVEADGWDALEPQIPLIRIYGDPVLQEDIARVETGQPYVCIRPAYHKWYAFVNIKWDADQFTLTDVTNLLSRMGVQNGIGEGRVNSKNGPGMGWGSFSIEHASELAQAA